MPEQNHFPVVFGQPTQGLFEFEISGVRSGQIGASAGIEQVLPYFLGQTRVAVVQRNIGTHTLSLPGFKPPSQIGSIRAQNCFEPFDQRRHIVAVEAGKVAMSFEARLLNLIGLAHLGP